jgi:hypothetical protein
VWRWFLISHLANTWGRGWFGSTDLPPFFWVGFLGEGSKLSPKRLYKKPTSKTFYVLGFTKANEKNKIGPKKSNVSP